MPGFEPVIHPWNQSIWQNLTHQAERSNHALLFTGANGLGKFDLAMALSHFVLSNSDNQSAKLFSAGSHPDFHLLTTENALDELTEDSLIDRYGQRYILPNSGKPRQVISVDQIRQLGEAIATHPHIASTRIVLLWQAEKLNTNAANALLKNLEEPPANTLFILVSGDSARLPATVRSRCSEILFLSPDHDTALNWLQDQINAPEHDLGHHLAMASNQPLLALQMLQENYIESLKTVFTDVNGLWNQQRDPVSTAKNWQALGVFKAVDILQKLCLDLLKAKLINEPQYVFFPVQQSWVVNSAAKISLTALSTTLDELIQARRLLLTTVDDLLVLETLSCQIRNMPVQVIQ